MSCVTKVPKGLTYTLDLQEILSSILKYLPFKLIGFLGRQESHFVHLLDGPLVVTIATHKVALTLWDAQSYLSSSLPPNSHISTLFAKIRQKS